MEIRLDNKTALVTGATGQLGRVMVRTLAACGANVVIHYRSQQQQATELLQEVEALGSKGLIVQADITKESSVMAMRDTSFAKFSKVDIIVANAVSPIVWKSILEQELEDYIDQVHSTMIQAVLLSKAFVPKMMEQKYGRIVAINTECAALLEPGQSAYSAAKRGMDGIYRTLAKEVGEHHITVNQIVPGWTISDRDRENHTEKQEAYEAHVPLRRRGTDQEIANMVAFFASDLASFTTGAFIPVNGGTTMPAI